MVTTRRQAQLIAEREAAALNDIASNNVDVNQTDSMEQVAQKHGVSLKRLLAIIAFVGSLALYGAYKHKQPSDIEPMKTGNKRVASERLGETSGNKRMASERLGETSDPTKRATRFGVEALVVNEKNIQQIIKTAYEDVGKENIQQMWTKVTEQADQTPVDSVTDTVIKTVADGLGKLHEDISVTSKLKAASVLGLFGLLKAKILLALSLAFIGSVVVKGVQDTWNFAKNNSHWIAAAAGAGGIGGMAYMRHQMNANLNQQPGAGEAQAAQQPNIQPPEPPVNEQGPGGNQEPPGADNDPRRRPVIQNPVGVDTTDQVAAVEAAGYAQAGGDPIGVNQYLNGLRQQDISKVYNLLRGAAAQQNPLNIQHFLATGRLQAAEKMFQESALGNVDYWQKLSTSRRPTVTQNGSARYQKVFASY